MNWISITKQWPPFNKEVLFYLCGKHNVIITGIAKMKPNSYQHSYSIVLEFFPYTFPFLPEHNEVFWCEFPEKPEEKK